MSADEFFSDLVPSKFADTSGGSAGASAAFSEDAVLLSSSLDGGRVSGPLSKPTSLPGTPMVRDPCPGLLHF